MSPPVRLHIERLVIDGIALDRAEGAQFQAALTEALTSLLRTAPPATAITERVVQVPGGVSAASPAALGTAVAACLHATLSPKASP